MKTRIKALIALLLIIIFCGASIFWLSSYFEGLEPSDNWIPQYSQLDRGVMAWELGDDIIPYPLQSEEFDCDDAVLHTYLWLKAIDEDLNIEIQKGRAWHTPYGSLHVWLVADNVTDSYIYDWGMAHQGFDGYEGRRITYEQLLRYAVRDQINIVLR